MKLKAGKTCKSHKSGHNDSRSSLENTAEDVDTSNDEDEDDEDDENVMSDREQMFSC